MIDEALDFLRLGKSRSNSHDRPANRPLITSGDLAEVTKPTEDLIRRYPAAALATAFLVGVAIAWWIKRK
jgi:hypothetical protein